MADAPGPKSVPHAAEWELDFCSRPMLDERGKKVWELLICSPDRSFEWSQYFPNNKINSGEVRRRQGQDDTGRVGRLAPYALMAGQRRQEGCPGCNACATHISLCLLSPAPPRPAPPAPRHIVAEGLGGSAGAAGGTAP